MSGAGTLAPPRTGLLLDGVSVRIPLPGRPRRYVHAADEVRLAVPGGSVTAVVGESGCGKSVLALTAMGLLPAGTRTSGSVWVDDVDVLGAGEEILRRLRGGRIALVPQSAATHLPPVRTVAVTIAETLRHHRRPSGLAAVEEHLAGVGLGPEVARRFPHELSGGMAQRVLVALAVCLEPGVVVADEPTSALDPVSAGLVLHHLRSQADQGRAVLLISHDLDAIVGVADRVAVMYAGRLLEVGPAEVVLDHPAHDYTAALLAALPRHGLIPPPGMPASLVDPPAGDCAWHRRAGRDCGGEGLAEITPGHLVACGAG